MLKLCAIVGGLVLLSGCSLFGKELDRAAEGAGKMVTFYCDNVTDPAIREQFRTAVNEHARPHSVTVNCVSGGEPLIVTSDPPTPSLETSR